MNTKTIGINEADDLSKREESHFFDRKSFLIKGAKVRKDLGEGLNTTF